MASRYHTAFYLLILPILLVLLPVGCDKPVVEPTYTVSFSSGVGVSPIPSQRIKEKQKAEKPANPARASYEFEAWYTTPNYSQVFDFNTPITADITLYAKWNLILYTATFKSEGDSTLELQLVVKGQKVVKPAIPTRKGYEFEDWYTSLNYSQVFDFNTPIMAAITLYAKWTPVFTVTFDSREGGAVKPQIIKKGEKAKPPTAPIRVGYVFGGWYNSQDFQGRFDFDTTKITSNITLYAKWDRIMYTVTFSREDGSGKVLTKSVAHGKKVSPPPPPIRDKYEFAGWHQDKTVKEPFIFDTTPIKSAITLYAKWNTATYTVTFDSNGGNDISQKIVDVERGKMVAKPVNPPMRDNYIFAYWYIKTVTSPTKAFDFTSAITADITLYAKWNGVKHTVTFVANGGSLVKPDTVAYGEKVKRPMAPIRAGYVFGGWYNSQDFQGRFDFDNTIIKGIITLYAKWDKVKHTVTFVTNGGSPIKPDTVAYGEKVKRPSDPPREGYTFQGWYADLSLNQVFDFDTTKITSNITLYAKWDKVKYTVTFDNNGGSLVKPDTVAYGEKVKRPTAPIRAGYVFGGWYSTRDFQGRFDFDNATLRASITLYAKWSEAVTVTFESNGGTVMQAKVVAKDSRINPPTAPTKGKLTLLAWYRDIALTQPFDFSTPVTTAITLYAKYGFRVPDDNFRKKLKTLVSAAFSIFNDEVMDVSHTAVTGLDSLNVSGSEIRSLVGIEYFTSLKKLYCSTNRLTGLDVSKNTALTTLFCSRDELTSLDVSKNTSLTNLICDYNNLTVLDVSKNTALSSLWCSSNKLTGLDVSSNTVLTHLRCSSNELNTLNVSRATALLLLWCQSNRLDHLDVSKNTALAELNCSGNELDSLNVSGATTLTSLYCETNQLDSLNVSGNTSLTTLHCYNNTLTFLDIRGITAFNFAGLSINAGVDGKNPLRILRVLDAVKDHDELKEAKKNREGAIAITTYNTDRTTVTCNNYDPNQGQCLVP